MPKNYVTALIIDRLTCHSLISLPFDCQFHYIYNLTFYVCPPYNIAHHFYSYFDKAIPIVVWCKYYENECSF